MGWLRKKFRQSKIKLKKLFKKPWAKALGMIGLSMFAGWAFNRFITGPPTGTTTAVPSTADKVSQADDVVKQLKDVKKLSIGSGPKAEEIATSFKTVNDLTEVNSLVSTGTVNKGTATLTDSLLEAGVNYDNLLNPDKITPVVRTEAGIGSTTKASSSVAEQFKTFENNLYKNVEVPESSFLSPEKLETQAIADQKLEDIPLLDDSKDTLLGKRETRRELMREGAREYAGEVGTGLSIGYLSSVLAGEPDLEGRGVVANYPHTEVTSTSQPVQATAVTPFTLRFGGTQSNNAFIM